MPKIAELYEDRAQVVDAQRAMLDKAEAEGRDLTAEESEQYNKMDADFERLTKEIRDAEAAQERRDKLAEREARLSESRRRPNMPDPADDGNHPEQRSASPGEAAKPRATDEYRTAFSRAMKVGITKLGGEEMRALQMDDDTTGGYIVAPEQFVNELIKAMDNEVFVRSYARIFSLAQAASLGVPVLDSDPDDPTWTAEIRTGTEDSAMDFAKRELYPHPLAKRIKISKKLVRHSVIGIEQLVRERLAYKFGTVLENAYLNGSGSNQPLGVFVASDYGIGTGQDVSTGNTNTAITADGLINCKYQLKNQYQRTARWIFHRDAIKMIRKLKDGSGGYVWQQGLAADRPDTILDLPYDISEYCPHTFTSGLYVGALCNWQFYWIADALDLQVQVLTELYAEANQNGYIGRMESDGMPVLSEAFARVTLS